MILRKLLASWMEELLGFKLRLDNQRPSREIAENSWNINALIP
jgi:hypothetical protein